MVLEIPLKEKIIPVFVKMVRKSYPVDQAMLCLPTLEDLDYIKKSEKLHESGPDIVHTDPIEKCNFEKALKNVTPEEYIDKLRLVKPSRKLGGNFRI